jgi:DNA repair exonuclease SbcCD ATPase subunit
LEKNEIVAMSHLFIRKISAQGIGPIKRFEKEFSPGYLYVIYGKNETGKTFLVEFIIRTLFYDVDFWGYTRKIDGEGKITISGIGKEDVEFAFRKSKNKNTLDKLLESRNYSLSPSLAKILLVKGGEVNLGKDVISKSILRNLLLERRIFEEIDSDSNISRTIKNAKIEDDKLIIDKRGEGKDYQEIKERLEKFDELIRELTEKLNLAEISTLELSIKELKEEKEKLERAKRYKAFKISQEIKEIEEELSKLPTTNELEEIDSKIRESKRKKKDYETKEKDLLRWKTRQEELHGKKEEYEKQLKAKRHYAYEISKKIENLKKDLEKYSNINDIEAKIKEYNKAKNEYEEKKREANKLSEEIKELPWIRSASESYAKFIEEKPKEPLNKLLIYISLTLLLMSIPLSLANIKILSIPLIILGTLTGGIYIYTLLKAFEDSPKKKELEDIKSEFKDKFNKDLKTYDDIKEVKQKLEEDEGKLNSLVIEIKGIETELKGLLREISESLKEITGEDIAPENWMAKLEDLKKKRNDLESQIKEKEKKLISLNVPEIEYELTDPGIEFDPAKFENLGKEIASLQAIEERISNLNEELQNLENEISILNDEIKNKLTIWFPKDIEENQWENEISTLKKTIESKKEYKNKLDGELKGLGIYESEYLKEDPGIEYNPNELKRIENELKRNEEEKEKKEKELLDIKTRICAQLNIDTSTPWDEILSLLFVEKEKTEKELKKILAKIIAGISVHQAIEKIKKQEEELLADSINSKEITKILTELTAEKYQKIRIEGDDIILSTNTGDYNIKDLSTGAKEQILLAIRIGIAQKLLGNNSAFLIFDDAFQHIDWEKRPLVVESLVKLSGSGWQIFYFTMDDNFKNLFEEKKKSGASVEIFNLF